MISITNEDGTPSKQQIISLKSSGIFPCEDGLYQVLTVVVKIRDSKPEDFEKLAPVQTPKTEAPKA